MFDYKGYWEQRGKTYQSEYPEVLGGSLDRYLPSDVCQRLQDVETILEVGCGWGRWTKVIKGYFEDSEITAIDISPELIEQAKEYFPDATYKVRDIVSYKTKNKFDLLFVYAILMHIPPELIMEVVEKLLNLCNKYMVIIEPFEYERKIAPYNWLHDYPSIFAEFGCQLEYEPEANDRKTTFFLEME